MKTTHVTQNDLSERWHLSPRTLERWRWEGIGPKFLKIGGRILYRIEDIEAYEEESIRQETRKDMGISLEQAA